MADRDFLCDLVMLITLLTDFGEGSYWVGVMKGVILSIAPQAQIIDITHSIPSHDIKAASFILKVSYSFFPSDTIHVIVVDPTVGTDRKVLVVRTEEYYFVAPDNGILSGILEEEKVKKIIDATNRKYFLPEVSSTFWGRDVFSPLAAYIAEGVPIEKFGREIRHEEIKRIELPCMLIEEDKITGEVLYVDKFGNLITNIEKKRLKEWIEGKRFSLKISGKRIERLVSNYHQARKGEVVALWGSTGYLEIATKEESASKLLRAGIGSAVIIKIGSAPQR